jgi:PAS domain S-box-containing protein
MPEPLHCDDLAQANHAQLYGILIPELTEYAVFLIDPDGCIASWNPGVERIFGYEEADWVTQHARIIFTPEDQAGRQSEQELETAKKQGRAPDVRWHQRKDGSRLFADGVLIALRDKNGILLGYSKVVRDITEKKRIQDELKVAYDEAFSILESITDGFIALDNRWRFVYVNAACERLTGGKREEWLGRSYWDVFASLTGTVVEQEFRRAVREQVPVEFDVLHPELQRWFAMCGYPTRQGGLSVYFQDITERKKLQAESERYAQELTRSNAELQQFAYVTSHDLQEPLRTMVNFSQLLAKRYGNSLGSDADQYLEYIVSGAHRMTGLVDSLLAYSRVLNDEKVRWAPVSLQSIVEWATMNLHTAIAESQASITSDEMPTLTADRALLVQLFQNLISNAIKYRNPAEPPQVHVSAQRTGNEWIVAVRDNGIGIEQKYAERIFGVFKRLHGKEIPGTGIGLAIAKRIVERHRGRIWVKSQPGEGSTFYIALPVV